MKLLVPRGLQPPAQVELDSSQDAVSMRKHIAKHVLNPDEAWHELLPGISREDLAARFAVVRRKLGDGYERRAFNQLPSLEVSLLAEHLDPLVGHYRSFAERAATRAAQYPALVRTAATGHFELPAVCMATSEGAEIRWKIRRMDGWRLATCFRHGRAGQSTRIRREEAVRKVRRAASMGLEVSAYGFKTLVAGDPPPRP